MTDTSVPDYSFEMAALSAGAGLVVGVDEVGRGPLAGPVTAAAVVLDPDTIPTGLNDSKKLTAARRMAIADEIYRTADVSVAWASVAEIDDLNILHASHLAMVRAVAGLKRPADFALIDGNRIPPDLPIPAQAVVKGDARSLSIAAASIVAKIHRDQVMADLAREYPGYGWEKNAGYPTKAHRAALLQQGVTPHHRVSFGPVRNMLMQGKK